MLRLWRWFTSIAQPIGINLIKAHRAFSKQDVIYLCNEKIKPLGYIILKDTILRWVLCRLYNIYEWSKINTAAISAVTVILALLKAAPEQGLTTENFPYRSHCHNCPLCTQVDIPVDTGRLSCHRAQNPDTVHRYRYSSNHMYRQGSLQWNKTNTVLKGNIQRMVSPCPSLYYGQAPDGTVWWDLTIL